MGGRKLIAPGKMVPPLTLMPWHLKMIAHNKLYFSKGIFPNFLHFVLKLHF